MGSENEVLCRDCGARYGDLGLDLVLPDQQWKAICPDEGGVLCANCICQRAAKIGGSTVILAWIDRIDWSTVSGHWQQTDLVDAELLVDSVKGGADGT